MSKNNDAYADAAQKAGEKIRSIFDQVAGEFTDTVDNVDGQLHDKPLQSTIIALGVGVVLGLLIGRR